MSVFILLSVLNGCRKKDDIDALVHSENRKTAAHVSNMETDFFKANQLLGGDVTIINAKLENINSQSQKVFTIDVATEGEYYLNAWINSPELINVSKGKFLSYDLIVNGEKLPSLFNVKKSGWHNASYFDKLGNKAPIHLRKGLNEIIFSCQGPVVPTIDFVRLGKDQSRSNIQEDEYSKYLTDINIQSQSNRQVSYRDTTGKSFGKSSTSISAVEPASNPQYDFDHVLNASFSYTYYTTVNLNAGQTAFFSTTPSSSGSFTHVLELFNYANPQGYSWTSLSNSSGIASININVPSTGSYYVRVRSYFQGQTGLVNLNINGQYYYTDCVASGSFGFRSFHNSNQVYNYFTANTTGDPRIWIEDNSALPGRIIGYNDDYYGGGGDHYWGLDSRIKKQFNTYVGAALVSSYSSYSPTGTTDLYVRAKNSNIMPYFPALKADDAIMSSPQSATYNCTAWTGGFTSFWFWGSTPNYYYGSAYVWSTWDDYYGNNPERYAGAMTYTPAGADESNGIVAMWAKPNGEITHGSIRKPGNYHAHGYAWESKPGSLARTFHPRDALNGTGYGSIVKYYRPATSSLVSSKTSVSSTTTGSKHDISFEESVAKGLTVIEPVELTNFEKSKIASRKVALRNGTKTINTLYDSWINKIKSDEYKSISNPYKFIETTEGQELLSYAKNNLEEAVLFFSFVIFDIEEGKAFEQNISYYMFCEIAKNKYGTLMENIKDNWKNNKFTADRRYIAPLPETFTKKYIKEIISRL